ncbi:MAG: metal ABC transporter substrate-binding protein [Deltaproteobacteria bacterium]|nr:metal ABC transporter substrate-binding protein [Deltaproteobacteria bacterium]
MLFSSSPLKKAGALVVSLAIFSLASAAPALAERLACASYPVWLIARYLTDGAERFQPELITNPATGCPHDFAPTPRDLERLTQTFYLFKNGLDLETYLDKALRVAPPDIVVIDASAGVPTLSMAWGRMDLGGSQRDDYGRLPTSVPNPHIFMSPKFAKIMAANLASKLKELDPMGANIYEARLASFTADMESLEEAIAAFKATRRGYKAVTSHGFLDYLAQDLGLAILADLSPSGTEAPPSAARLRAIADLVKQERVTAIFVDPEADPGPARTLSRETGAAAAVIDPATSGPANPPLDYYQMVLKEDLALFEEIFPPNYSPPGGDGS